MESTRDGARLDQHPPPNGEVVDESRVRTIAQATAHRVAIAGSDVVFACREDETLVHAAQRAGHGFPYECNSGSCATCRFTPVSGEFSVAWEAAPGLSERDRGRGRLLACQVSPRSDAVIDVALESAYCAPIPPDRHHARLVARHPVTHDMAEFACETEGAAEFLPGQYALLTIPGIGGARAYSMCNLPNAEGEWRFLIKHKPGGSVTSLLFDRVASIYEIEICGPYGMAYCREHPERETVCIAGGAGLSPMLSIVRRALSDLRNGRRSGPVTLFFGGREPRDTTALRNFSDVAAATGRELQFIPAISESGIAPHEWTGERGFIHEVTRRIAGPRLASAEVYLAGPPPMVRATLEMLQSLGTPRTQIHYDNFF